MKMGICGKKNAVQFDLRFELGEIILGVEIRIILQGHWYKAQHTCPSCVGYLIKKWERNL